MTPEKKPVSLTKALLIAATAGAVGSAAVKYSGDSAPVHFNVRGQAPTEAPGWTCAPEGGLFGAPLVCRPSAAAIAADGSETK